VVTSNPPRQCCSGAIAGWRVASRAVRSVRSRGWPLRCDSSHRDGSGFVQGRRAERWMSVEVVGKEGWLKVVAIPPSEWQPSRPCRDARDIDTERSVFAVGGVFACEWQFAQFAAAKSSCGFLRAGSCRKCRVALLARLEVVSIGNRESCRLRQAHGMRHHPLQRSVRVAEEAIGVSPRERRRCRSRAESHLRAPGRPSRCAGILVGRPWQTVQSTLVDSPVVWQLLQEIVPREVHWRPHQAWTSPRAKREKDVVEARRRSPFGWQLRQLAVSVGTAVICQESVLETTWSTASLCSRCRPAV